MKKFIVKTRNFNCQKWVKDALKFSYKWGVDGYFEPDNDGKIWLYTDSLVHALFVLAYFKILSPFSGGWTYILNQKRNHSLAGYKTFYL
jgi:hypothetical protein